MNLNIHSFFRKHFRGPIAYEPGQFAKENSELIEIQSNWLKVEKLWIAEAAEAKNPERRSECLKLAELAREFHDRAVSFYSRWQIAP